MTRTSADIPKVELHLHLEGAASACLHSQSRKEKHIDIFGHLDEKTVAINSRLRALTAQPMRPLARPANPQKISIR